MKKLSKTQNKTVINSSFNKQDNMKTVILKSLMIISVRMFSQVLKLKHIDYLTLKLMNNYTKYIKK